MLTRCQKLWTLVNTRQSYCNEKCVQFFWPTLNTDRPAQRGQDVSHQLLSLIWPVPRPCYHGGGYLEPRCLYAASRCSCMCPTAGLRPTAHSQPGVDAKFVLHMQQCRFCSIALLCVCESWFLQHCEWSCVGSTSVHRRRARYTRE